MPAKVPLTDRLLGAVASPATDDEFDVYAAFGDVLAGIGMHPEDSGGRVEFIGADPIVPSTLRLGAAGAIGLAAKSAAVAKLSRLRSGAGQDIAVDLRTAVHRLAPFHGRWERLNGYPPAAPVNASPAFGFEFYRTADDRWVMPLNPYPRIKVAAQRLLGAPDDVDAVAAAIRRRRARDLEEDGARAGVVLPMLRTLAELTAEPHFRDGLAEMPLIEITRIADSAPEPLPATRIQPLDGVRALGMGHVIAGAGTGRALALHGADVLNLWRPGDFEHDVTYLTANVGIRSSTVDPFDADGARLVRALLADADVFFANRRPGYLARIGLTAEQAAQLRPGIVHATISLNGERGPWADRVGFDQSAGCLTGAMLLEGTPERPALSPITVVNDYLVAWLLTTGIVEALARRAVAGGSYRVHVSLTRVALWILGMGYFDRDYAAEVAGTDDRHRSRTPEMFTADTPLGRYRGLTEQVSMSATPGWYRTVLMPRGAARPGWLVTPRRRGPAGR
ncbi:Formyl-CoA:oxalate CoA-transferase [Nocardia sp. RB20]|uniref:Formyl-CoA:oxalate CoA-transferase n=2 Tax=Nocardia macrotermitis TaxID=2585198 RepID=A0A7K0D392_9NOCA|nr:Formyl-CoA:oxalate CoA-transferase [Nocardia macrotermitis]